ncbi:MAG: acetyl esterase [Shewanella sp.]
MRRYDPDLKYLAKHMPEFNIVCAEKGRQTLKRWLSEMAPQYTHDQIHPQVNFYDIQAPGLPGQPNVTVRIYQPKQQVMEPRACYLNIHGGGFIMGDLNMEHARCLAFAVRCNAVCVSIDYRLAPEHPYPAALNDCYATLQWLALEDNPLNIDKNRIVVGGISAGGALAVSLALMSRDLSGPLIAMQMLFYPALDDRCQTDSMIDGEDLYIWNRQNCVDMWRHYLGGQTPETLDYAVPARAEDVTYLPTTYLSVCEHDPLRDEGLEYGCRLLKNGVQVELHCFAGTIHGFDFMQSNAISSQAVDEMINFFNRWNKTAQYC